MSFSPHFLRAPRLSLTKIEKHIDIMDYRYFFFKLLNGSNAIKRFSNVSLPEYHQLVAQILHRNLHQWLHK